MRDMAYPLGRGKRKASFTLSHATQSGRHPLSERGPDLYSTPPCAIEALFHVEALPHRIWEPAAGRGAIANVLREHGHFVVASDLHDWGCPASEAGIDFLQQRCAPAGVDAVVTNPPGALADEFARHALDLVPEVYLLLRLAFLESTRRTDILEERGLRKVHVFRNRLPFMHRDSWTGPRAASAIAFAWFCWSRNHEGPTIIDRISWSAS